MTRIGIFGKKRPAAPTPEPIHVGRIGTSGVSRTTIPGYKSRTNNLLEELRRTSNVYDAIALICEKHPDANMALTSMLRLANSGHKVEFYGPDAKRDTGPDGEWRAFSQRVNGISNSGMDGLIDQFHKSSMQFGGMACETVVRQDMSDIEDVYVILPQSITWEMDKDKGIFIPYQTIGMKKVNLLDGNFSWVAHEANVGQPTGSLMFESALQPIDQQLQFFTDIAAVIRRVGYPRNDISINKAAVLAGMPASERNDPIKQKKGLQEYFDFVIQRLDSLGPLSDIVHFDDVVLGNGSAHGDSSRTLDIRAVYEMMDPQVLNGLSCLAILANRPTGVTETWGTVQYKIIVETLKGLQRGSKRLVENVANIWLRVHGYQLVAKFEHNPVDWEAEIAKLDASLKKQQIYRKAEEYGWLSSPDAARGGMNITTLPKEVTVNRFEHIKKFAGESSESNTSGEGNGSKE